MQTLLGKLEPKLEADVVGPEDSNLVKKFKKIVKDDLSGRYQDPDVRQILLLSCLVDPRTRELAWVSDKERKEMVKKLELEALKIHEQVWVVQKSADILLSEMILNPWGYSKTF